MTLPKILATVVVILFIAIGAGAVIKKGKLKPEELAESNTKIPLEVELDQEIFQETVVIVPEIQKNEVQQVSEPIKPKPVMISDAKPVTAVSHVPVENLPDANRIEEFFNKNDPKLPIVETITYQSRVGWQKGRPAWLSDYASHYQTSRHFIARSLNGKPDYFKQDIADGDRFNVLKLDKDIQFYLVIDTTRSKMWFYYYDKATKEKTLLKTYAVGLGRIESGKTSGSLTPLGKYSLGNKIAIYKPKMMGFHNGQKVEMIRIFGTRWIPFEKEVSDTTAPAKGFGIHGVPWVENDKGELVQDASSIGKYDSDGCIRLATADMEELFSIIITKPTIIELVKDFKDAK